jgi:hypothetical protein
VARAIVYWVVFSATSWILGAIMDHVFGDERSSAAWLTFLGFVLVAIIVNTYLHAKLVFYVVSSVYEDPPKSLLQSWTASRNLTPALFRAFLVLELVAGCVQLGFWFLGYLLPGMKTLTTGIADWLGIASDVAYYVVPTNIGAILASALVVLMGGAISIVAFRADLAREYRAARVFE